MIADHGIIGIMAERNALPLLHALARRGNNPRRNGPEQAPRAFFSVRRRAVPANHAMPTHANANVSTVADCDLRRGKLSLRAAQMLAEARAWAEELTAIEVRKTPDINAAWSSLERHTGVPASTFWSLRYRFDTLKSIDGPIHSLLRDAHIAEAERQLRRFQQITAIRELTTGKSVE